MSKERNKPEGRLTDEVKAMGQMIAHALRNGAIDCKDKFDLWLGIFQQHYGFSDVSIEYACDVEIKFICKKGDLTTWVKVSHPKLEWLN